jgi:hypothetical protein
MSDNLKIWDALGKTDPKHTKGFNRAGGFKGTAIKPIYIQKRLTDQFGPCGVGWGMGEPRFEVVHADGEILVYCTVSCWHTKPENVLWGVGGDKVQAKRKDGPFCDDEAFKKAFTDAVGNAFKSIGVGADVHMGLFDDDKYVTAAKAEFAEAAQPDAPSSKPEELTKQQLDALALIDECDTGHRLDLWLEEYGKHFPKGSQSFAAANAAFSARKRLIESMDRAAA